tara:strand:- start:653 stop:961 length:309 start_codon:yes stop_codon:yes gene_type:complete
MSDYDPGDSTDYDPDNPGNGLSASDPEGNAFYWWRKKQKRYGIRPVGLRGVIEQRERDWRQFQWETGRMMDQFNLLCEEMSREEAVKRMESYGFANFESDWM